MPFYMEKGPEHSVNINARLRYILRRYSLHVLRVLSVAVHKIKLCANIFFSKIESNQFKKIDDISS